MLELVIKYNCCFRNLPNPIIKIIVWKSYYFVCSLIESTITFDIILFHWYCFLIMKKSWIKETEEYTYLYRSVNGFKNDSIYRTEFVTTFNKFWILSRKETIYIRLIISHRAISILPFAFSIPIFWFQWARRWYNGPIKCFNFVSNCDEN